MSDVKVLTVWTSEPYFLLTRTKQVKTLEDIKGMKIRAVGSSVKMIESLGGVAVVVAAPEVYVALERGVIDGVLTIADAIMSYKWFEVARYYTYVPTGCYYFMLVMNKDVWNSMPYDVQLPFRLTPNMRPPQHEKALRDTKHRMLRPFVLA